MDNSNPNADQLTKTIELQTQNTAAERHFEKAKVIPVGRRARRGTKQIVVYRDKDDDNLR